MPDQNRNAKIAYRIEIEFLLDIIRIDAINSNGEGKFVESGDMDWSTVINLALEHQIMPIVYQWQKSSGSEKLPAEIITRIHMLFIENELRNFSMIQKLNELIKLLSENGIENLVYKGPALAIQAYGDLNLRTFTDLDILVQRKDVPRTFDILMKSGFTPDFPINQYQQEWLIRSETEYSFLRQWFLFEIHWEVAELGIVHPLNSKIFWENREIINLLDGKIQTFNIEDAIFLACLHGTKHQWKLLKWVTDLAHLCQANPGMDWSALLDRAKKAGMHRLVCLSLNLAQSIGGFTFPAHVWIQIQEEDHAAKIASQVINTFKLDLKTQGVFDDSWFYLQCRERWRDRLYYILDQLFIPKQADCRCISLPHNLYFIYYFIRPIRLFLKFGRLGFRVIFSKLSYKEDA